MGGSPLEFRQSHRWVSQLLVQADRTVDDKQDEDLLLAYRVVDVEGLGIDETKQTPLGVVDVPEAGELRQVLGREAVDIAQKFISVCHAVLALVTVDFLKGIFRRLGDNDLHA